MIWFLSFWDFERLPYLELFEQMLENTSASMRQKDIWLHGEVWMIRN